MTDATELAVTADTASASTATGVSGDATGYVLAVAAAAKFNIRFSHVAGTAPADPSNAECFEAGVHFFRLNKLNTHFKITVTENGVVLYWKASRT